MATIGSNIDVRSIVSQLMQVERRPRMQLMQQAAGVETKISAFGRLQSAVSSFQTAVQALGVGNGGNATWSAARASSSDDATVGVSASAGATAGGYAIDVVSLAQRQAVATQAFSSSTTAMGGGDLSIQFGKMSGEGAFEPDTTRTAASIKIEPNASLSEVRDAINKAKAGVSATLVADGGGQRLMLRSDTTGAAQAFSLSVANAEPGSGLASLAFDPANTSAGDGRVQATQTAADAVVKVNGLEVTSATNSVTGVIENVTLDLKRVSTSTINVNVTSDIGSMRSKIDGFVRAYNDLTKLINEQTKYDEVGKKGAVLQGNSAPLRIQSQMRDMLRSAGGGSGEGDFPNLNALGVELTRDGTLKVDDTRMTAALAKPEALQRFFSGAGTGETATDGFAKKMDHLLGGMLATGGVFSSITSGLNATKTQLDKRMDAFDKRMEDVESRLTKQYTSLDVNLQRITASYSSVQGLVSGLMQR